jgi:hypothetical protein
MAWRAVKAVAAAAGLMAVALAVGLDGSHAVQPAIWTLDSPNGISGGGFSFTSMGELDGDARADIVVGAPGETVGMNATQGRAYAFSGATGALMWTFNSPNPQAGGQFGYRVHAGANVDTDPEHDVIVSAPYETVGMNTAQGRVYVFSGATGAHIRTLNTPNPQIDAHFGIAIAAGDIDGDGRAEIVVGAPDEDVGMTTVQGRAYVYSGATGALMKTLDSLNPETSGTFGGSVAVGRINAGTVADIVVGASGETVDGVSEQGRAYVFEGGTWAELGTLVSPNPQEFSGCCIVGVGDVDGDGLADIAMGATHEDVTVGATTHSAAGRVYVFNARADGMVTFPLMKTLRSPNPESDLIFGFGLWITMGEIVHAGRADIVVGAPFETVGADGGAGRAYVFGGQTGALMYAIESPAATAFGLFGGGFAGTFLDVNGDSKPDIPVGALNHNGNKGRVYVLSGPNTDDLDGDGCSASEEGGMNPLLGGGRNPANEWDFYDVNGSRKIDAVDVGLVRSRFTGGAEAPPESKIYNRSSGPPPYAPGPPDLTINAADIGLVRSAFNHSCIAPP